MFAGCGLQKNIEAKGVFHEFQGIFTMVEPGNLELYRSLLPAPLEMPEQPLVSMFVIDYLEVYPWPMTRYQEGTVALRCKYQGQEGWHVKTMPVTKWVANWGGRALGFPKYVTKEITLARAGHGWKGEVRNKGEEKLTLEFSPGLARELDPKEEILMQGGVEKALADPIFLLVPPDQGPTLQKVVLTQVVTPSWHSEPGTVRISIGPGEPWSGLIPPGTVSPGFFATFRGGANLVPTKLAKIK